MKSIILFSFVCTTLVLGFVSCGGDGDKATSYSGPGSFWKASISSSVFTMERSPSFEAAVDLTVSGGVTTLSSGYKEFTVVSATGVNPPVVGEKAYGFEIPGFFTLVKPMNSTDDKLLPMLSVGGCPTADVDFNWVVTSYGGNSDLATAADIVGVASYAPASGAFSIPAQHSLDGTDVTNSQTMTGTCADGFMQIDTNADSTPDVDMWLSASGGALVRTPEDTVIVAMPAESVSAANLLSKSFIGLVFNESNVAEKVAPVWLETDASGALATAGLWTDITSNTKGLAASQLTFSAFNSPQLGFVQVALAVDTNLDGSFDATGGNMICQFKSNLASSGKDMLFCAGHIPGNTSDLFNVLLVSE